MFYGVGLVGAGGWGAGGGLFWGGGGRVGFGGGGGCKRGLVYKDFRFGEFPESCACTFYCI